MSLSPLTAPAVGVESDALEGMVGGFNESEAARERAARESDRE